MLVSACGDVSAAVDLDPVVHVLNEVTVTPTCPVGMVHVVGDYCHNVNHTCKEWLDPPSVKERFRRCLTYYPSTCISRMTSMDFCIDAYEYAEPEGILPLTYVTWASAKATCESIGKRLCTDEEWTLACEGPEMLPFPYGRTRDHNVCYADKYMHEMIDEKGNLRDLRAPVKTHEMCTSPFGVRNMVGNVGEWVMYDEADPPYRSGGKGGWWCIGLRSRCRPITLGHGELDPMIQVGFRCCDDS